MEAQKLWNNQLELNLQQPSNSDGLAEEQSQRPGQRHPAGTVCSAEGKSAQRKPGWVLNPSGRWALEPAERERRKKQRQAEYNELRRNLWKGMTPDQKLLRGAKRKILWGDKIRESSRNYRLRHLEECRARARENKRKRMATDPKYRALERLRHRLYIIVKRGFGVKVGREEYTGCSREFLMAHIESKFGPGMTWDNYGKNGWHIDHIRPCDSFDLTDPKQVRQCFHYTNLQPLWGPDNLKKSNKWIPNKAA